jgi:DNA-binding transcriptional ArsR family regulator
MTNKKYLNLELGDPRLKEISEVLGNKKCKKILDLLSEEELTISDISEKLNIPMNTAQYNIQKLVKTGLIETNDYFWSLRKKKMPRYTVSNKKILISPKKFSRKIAIVSSFVITGLISLIIKNLGIGTKQEEVFSKQDAAILTLNQAETLATNTGASASSVMQPWMWFLLGCWLALLIGILTVTIIERREK